MNPFKRLTAPRLPSVAIGLSNEDATVVSLDLRRNQYAIRRAGHTPLPEGLLHPSFDETNIPSPNELAGILAELVTSVGLHKRHRWSMALPEAATRTSIITLETTPASKTELEEMLRWKTERVMAAPPDEVRVSRQRLRPDATGRSRYLITATRLEVLAEYEEVFAALGWHAGLVLPRHMGETWWLMQGGDAAGMADSLLVSTHAEGFTAVLLRGGEPLLVRNVLCDSEDRADELFRFVLFYRDRLTTRADGGPDADAYAMPGEAIERLLITGSGLDGHTASATIEETLSVAPRTLQAEDVRLSLPSRDLDFNLLAGPAGLAALAWA